MLPSIPAGAPSTSSRSRRRRQLSQGTPRRRLGVLVAPPDRGGAGRPARSRCPLRRHAGAAHRGPLLRRRCQLRPRLSRAAGGTARLPGRSPRRQRPGRAQRRVALPHLAHPRWRGVRRRGHRDLAGEPAGLGHLPGGNGRRSAAQHAGGADPRGLRLCPHANPRGGPLPGLLCPGEPVLMRLVARAALGRIAAAWMFTAAALGCVMVMAYAGPAWAVPLDAVVGTVNFTTVSASDIALARALSLFGFTPSEEPIRAADV